MHAQRLFTTDSRRRTPSLPNQWMIVRQRPCSHARQHPQRLEPTEAPGVNEIELPIIQFRSRRDQESALALAETDRERQRLQLARRAVEREHQSWAVEVS